MLDTVLGIRNAKKKGLCMALPLVILRQRTHKQTKKDVKTQDIIPDSWDIKGVISGSPDLESSRTKKCTKFLTLGYHFVYSTIIF